MCKKGICVGFYVLGLTLALAHAEEPWKLQTEGPYATQWRLELFNRIRGEFVDWFDSKTRESTYNFTANKFQLGLRVLHPKLESFVQFQDTFLTGLPKNGVGIGANYFLNTPETTGNRAFLRQGWARFKHGPFYLQGGRQLYSDSAQGAASHPALKWIQDFRFAQRLIGPFDYTHTGRSFDGGTLGVLTEDFELSGFAFMPTFGGFEIAGQSTITDIHVAGLSLNLRDSKTFGNSLGRLFWIYYDDNRELVATDNRPLAVRRADRGEEIRIHTLGTSAAKLLALGPGLADGLFFFYGQFGDWQTQDHRAFAYGVEAGYQLPDFWGTPWLRAGINVGSGDSSPNDGTHKTFFQMLSTPWLYAMFPFYNMMNNQDVFAQLILKPHPTVTVRADFHWLKLKESKDLVYAGAGATSDRVFGIAGSPSGGSRELAYLAHVMLSFKPIPYLAFNLLYAHAFGQEALDPQFSGRQANYGFAEAIVSF
ncbi:MAG: alginate export family protein [Methylohalobius sp.]